jgi:SNF2 family DNA or RNA helicase
MNFIDPSTFRDVTQLSNEYADLNSNTVKTLHQQIKPYFLRRTKDSELKELPPKKEIIVPLSMTRLQKELYKDTLVKGTKLVAQLQKQASGDSESTGKKVNKNYNNVIMILRKILNHPYLLPGVEVPYDDVAQTRQAMVDACGKLKLLNIMLPKLFSQGHRVLIFSTMAIALDVLEDYMTDANITYVRLDGSTKQVDRVERIDAFNAPNSDVKVFLLTTRAGGVGINLATSDTVIIYDSDFNPHCDLQAISRAHRFGQQSPVLVLRFITRLTVEERIVEKSKKKMVLDHLVVDKMGETNIESEDVESIIKFGLKALFDEDSAPKDIVYDSAAVDELLDRETIFSSDEPKEPEADASTENKSGSSTSSFSFAKIWRRLNPQSDDASSTNSDVSNDQENNDNGDQDKDVWEKLLTENERQLEKEALLATENLGRGARKRKAIVSGN